MSHIRTSPGKRSQSDHVLRNFHTVLLHGGSGFINDAKPGIKIQIFAGTIGIDHGTFILQDFLITANGAADTEVFHFPLILFVGILSISSTQATRKGTVRA